MSEKVDFDFAISVKAPEELRQLPIMTESTSTAGK